MVTRNIIVLGRSSREPVEVFALRALLPLAKGRLSDFRREVRARLVLMALTKLADQGPVSAETVKATIISACGFSDYPIEVVIAELNQLVTTGTLTKKAVLYNIVKTPGVGGYEALRHQIEREFEAFMRSRDKEFDLYEYRGWKDALGKSLDQVMTALISSFKDEEDNQTGIYAGELKENILKHWGKESPKLPRAGEYFLEFLQASTGSAKTFVAAVYEAILTTDLLARGRELEGVLQHGPPPDRVYLDTNCISALLCPTNKYNEATIASITLACRFGFEVGYVASTSVELNNLLRSANWVMKQGDVVEGAGRNEFVLDYTRRVAPSMKWSDYLSEVEMWPQRLQQLGVKQFEDLSLSPDDIDEYFESTFKIFLKANRVHREREAISHDVQLYHLVRSRKGKDAKLFHSPLVETLDRTFWDADTFLVQEKGFQPCLVHVTSWLGTLSQFLDATFEEKDIARVATGVLRNLIEPSRPMLSIQEYARLLAARYDWEPDQAELLARVLTESIHKSELERALSESNPEKVAEITQRAFSDIGLIEEVVGRKRAEAEKEELRDRMESMAQEVLATRKILRYVREAASRPMNISVQVPGVSDQFLQLLARLIDDIEKQLPELSKAEGIDKSLLSAPDEKGIRKSLAKIETALQRAAGSVSAAQVLYPVAREIANFLGYLPVR